MISQEIKRLRARMWKMSKAELNNELREIQKRVISLEIENEKRAQHEVELIHQLSQVTEDEEVPF